MLQNTEVDDVNFESFNLPYDNFFLSLKHLKILATNDSSEIIDGVYIGVQNPKQNGLEELDYGISLDFVGNFKELRLKYKDTLWDSSSGDVGADFWSYCLWFSRNEKILTIKESLTDVLEMFKNHYFPENSAEVNDIHLDIFNYHMRFIESTIKVVVNCLLYLSLPKESKDLKNIYPTDLPHNFNKKLSFAKTNREKTKIEKKIIETGFSKIFIVGDSFKNYDNNFKSKGIQISPHWRKGHWRNQVYGENYSQKKLIWIRPTIVNKDIGEPIKGHLYVDK